MGNCDKYQQMISTRLDEAPASDNQAELDSHVVQCADCRAFLESSMNARAVLSTLPFVSPTRTAPTPPRQLWWKRKTSIPLPLAAAVILIMALGWLLPLNTQNTPDSVAPPLQPYGGAELEVIVLPPVSAVLISSTTQSSREEN